MQHICRKSRRDGRAGMMIAAFILAICLADTAARAATCYVAETGDDANSGAAWDQAFRTISNAVAQAGNGSATNTILVSNGVYTVTST